MYLLIAELWILSPFILIPIIIILSVKYRKLKNKINTENSAINSSDMKINKISEKIISEINNNKKVPDNPPNTKPKINPINVILIIGVIFIILAGVIFSTTNWNVMSNLVKTLVIFSASIFFYAVSIFAERKLKLQKIGIAFFSLGSIFLPISVIAIGFFELFGGWFSFEGHGSDLILMVSSTVLCLTAGIGAVKYKSEIFAMASLSGITGAVIFMSTGMFNDINFSNTQLNLCSLVFAVYALFTIISCKKIKLSENFRAYEKVMDKFIVANTSVLSILAFAYSDTNSGFSGLSVIMFSIMFLNSMFNKKLSIFGIFPFAIYIMLGFTRFNIPESCSDFMAFFCASALTSVILSEMNFVSDILKRALKKFSYVMMICTAFSAIMDSADINYSPDIISLVSLALVLLNTLWLSLRYNSRPANIIHPFISVIFAGYLSRFISDDYHVGYFIILLAVFVLYYIVPKTRTIVSDIIFIGICFFECMSIDTEYAVAGAFGSLCLAVMLTMIALDGSKRIRSVISSYFIVFALLIGISWLTDDFNFDYSITSTLLRTLFIVVLISSMVIPMINQKNFTTFRFAKGIELWVYIFGFVNLLDETFPYLYLIGVFCAMRVYSSLKYKLNKQALFYIYFTMSSITGGILISLRGNCYHRSLIILASIGALFMAAQLIITEKNKNFFLNTPFYNFAHISMSTAVIIGSVVWFESICSKPYHFIFWCVLCIIMYIYSYKYKGNNLTSFISVGALYFLNYNMALKYFEFKNGSMVLILSLIFILSLAIGRTVHYFMFIKQIQKPECDEWLTILSAVMPLIIIWISLSGNSELTKWTAIAWLMFAVYCVFYISRTESPFIRKILMSSSCGMICLALISQRFIIVDWIFEREYNVIILMIMCLMMKKIWHDYFETIDIIAFLASVFSIFVLFSDIFKCKQLLDVEMLISACIILMIIAFIRKRRKWFLLSSVSVLFTAVYMTKDFWLSIQWWIYLLVIGITLVTVAGINEYLKTKNKSVKIIAGKLFTEWKW